MFTEARPRPPVQPFGGYYQRDVPREDAELTHVGPGTPCGEYLRRFWQPVGLSAELGDLPKRIRILGEDLVLFRDGSSRVGLLALHCSHRGTSLEYGRIQEHGIRCCYHGWLFDVDGRVLETPAEPAESTYQDRICHGAYPTQEYKGLVFAYLGPPATQPALPILDVFELPGAEISPMGYTIACNWLQVKENCMDPVHTSFLHSQVNGTQFTEAFGEIGVIQWQETPIGMVYIQTRRVGEMVWVRVSDFIPPNIHQFGREEECKDEKVWRRPQATNWAVPIDDTQTLAIGLRYRGEERTADPALTSGTRQRSYEEKQRLPGDREAQISQRPIAVHALEHLGWSDSGVIRLRRILREGIRAVAAGGDPPRVSNASVPAGTYAQNTVLRVPRAGTMEQDDELLREIGQKAVAGYYLEHPPAGVPVLIGV